LPLLGDWAPPVRPESIERLVGFTRHASKFCLLKYRFHNVKNKNVAAHQKISIREMSFRIVVNDCKSLIYIGLLSLI
jgi:hypothetical protein